MFDVRSELRPILDSVRDCAVNLQLPDESHALALTHEFESTHRVALLGEQPGKAQLVNDFLGVKVLEPFQGLHRRRVVSFGPEPSLRIGERRVPLDEGGWAAVETTQMESLVRVESPAPRARGRTLVDLELVKPSRSNWESWVHIRACHSLVMVLNATSGLTRTELNLLREIALRRGPELIAVFVLGIEKVDQNERQQVVSTVGQRVKSLLQDEASVFAPSPDPGGALLQSCLAAREQQLRLGIADDRRVALSLLAWAEFLSETCKARSEGLVRPTLATRRTSREQALRIEEKRKAWLEVRLALRSGVGPFTNLLNRNIGAAGRHLASLSLRSYVESPDKYAWLQDEFTDELHSGLLRIAQSCEHHITAYLASALSMIEPLGISLRPPALPVLSWPDPAPPPLTAFVALKRSEWLSWLLAIGGGAASVAPPLLQQVGAPLPSLSPVVELTAEYRNTLSRRVPEEVRAFIRRSVHSTVAEFAETTAAAVRSAMRELIDEVDRRWHEQERVESGTASLVTDKQLESIDMELHRNIEVLRRLL